MRNHDRDQEAIDAQATAWASRRDAGLTGPERVEFERWCKADPRHAESIAALEAPWRALARPGSANLNLLRAQLRTLSRRRGRRLAFGIAAMLIAAFAGGIWLQRAAQSSAPATLATARVLTPEQRLLPDGSRVELRAGSEIEVRFAAGLRWVRLVRGEAIFEVAKDRAHPFVVAAGPVEVRAVGTAFTVNLAPKEVEVLVTEGRVSVGRNTDPPPGSGTALVSAGHRIVLPIGAPTAAPARSVELTPVESEQRLAWRAPRLEFPDTSIAEAVALFNRSNRVQLRAGDETVAALRVTGIFRADNVQGFVNLLESSFGVRAERHGKNEIVLYTAR